MGHEYISCEMVAVMVMVKNGNFIVPSGKTPETEVE